MMDDNISTLQSDLLEKTGMLVEALPFMRRYSDQTLVVKFGGHAMGEADYVSAFAADIALLDQVGARPVVVHGGGPQIGAMLDKVGVESEFVDGLRVTDQQTIDVVEMVLAGKINKEIVSNINAAGGVGVGLCGKDANLITARKLTRTKRDPESNIEKVLDLGGPHPLHLAHLGFLLGAFEETSCPRSPRLGCVLILQLRPSLHSLLRQSLEAPDTRLLP